jgi:hypothetical protein
MKSRKILNRKMYFYEKVLNRSKAKSFLIMENALQHTALHV